MSNDLRRKIARDAGHDAAYRNSTPSNAPVLNLTRRYLVRWMLDGDEDLVVAFAAGVYSFFSESRHLTVVGVAELLTGVTVREDSSLTYSPSHFPHIHGVSDAQMEQMARRMFDLIASTNLAYT